MTNTTPATIGTARRSTERDTERRSISTHFDFLDTAEDTRDGAQFVRLTITANNWRERKQNRAYVSAVLFTPSTPGHPFAVTSFSMFGQDPAPLSDIDAPAPRYNLGKLEELHAEMVARATHPASFGKLAAWALAQREVNAA